MVMIQSQIGDHSTTEQFLKLFGDRHQYFALPTKGSGGYYGTYERNKSGLERENEEGKDIYFTVNEAKPGVARTKDKFVKVRAVWIDDDGVDKDGGQTDPSKFPLEPNIIVQSSPGKFHYYWLTETDNAEQAEQVLRGIAASYNGDPAVTDRLRILRLPGFIHNKSKTRVTYTIQRAAPYSWAEILTAFPPLQHASVDTTTLIDRPKFSVKDAIEGILSGEDIHGSRRSLAMHWANSNMPKEDALATLNGYVEDAMRAGTIDKGRAMERLANMKQAVVSAYAKVDLEEPPKFVPKGKLDESKFTHLPRAEGVLGEIADSVMVYMPYPSYEMALVVAQHVVSVFGGGMYHVKNKTCTRKRTILAATGRGKSVVDKYYNELVRRLALREDLINPYNFNGNNSYAVNNIHMELIDHRVRSYIMSEAGLMGKSTAGTTSETRAYILNLISSSRKSATNAKLLSVRTSENRKMNEGLKTVYGAVAVFVSESVPAQYVEVLNNSDAFLSGDVAREELIFVDPTKPPMNFDAEGDLPDSIVDSMAHLAAQFEDAGHTAGDDPSNPDKFVAVCSKEIDKLFVEHCSYNLELENDASREGDTVQAAMLSRIPEKILVTCLLQAIADSTQTGSLPRITAAHFHFAVQYHTELMRSLLAQKERGALADPVTLCVERVTSYCQSFGSRSNDKTFAQDFQKKIVSRAWLTYVLDRSKFKPIDSLIQHNNNRRELVIREIIQQCEDINLITPVPGKGKIQLWRINT